MSATLFFGAVGAYVVVVGAIGLFNYRRASSAEGFLVAGRSLGPIVGGATLMANQVSAGATIGMVGFHYFSGISYAWTWPMVWVGWLVAAVLVAPKIRNIKGLTLPDYFAARFESEACRALAAVFILGAYSVMLSAQFQAGGLLLMTVGGIDYRTAVSLVAGVTVVYTVLGGMYSNAYVGLLKAGLLLVAYVLAVPWLWKTVGGLNTIGAALQAMDPRLTHNWFGWRQLIAISFAVGLGIAAAPYEISAIYAMQSRRAARLAIGWSFVFQGCVGIGILLFGLSARVAMPYLHNPDLATPVLGMQLLPRGIGVLVLLAAVVTLTRTGGAILLTTASAVSHDLYAKLLRPQASDREQVFVGRMSVIFFSTIPVWFALRQFDLVNFVVIYAAKLTVSFLFIPIVVGLHWRGGTKWGALVSMAAGLSTCLAATQLGRPYVFGLDPAEAGVLVSAIAFVGVSALTPKVSAEGLRVFFAS